MTASPTTAPYDHPNCRESATTVVRVERERGSVKIRVCDTHCAQAQVIARQHEGIAYRLQSI